MNSKGYTVRDATSWYEEYKDINKTVQSIADRFNVKSSTMVRHFVKLGFPIRPAGFRVDNYKGRSDQDTLRKCYLWFCTHTYKRRAKMKNLEFTLSDDEFISLVTSDCAYCGKDWKSETRRVHNNTIKMLTVDRVNSKLGYSSDNCVSACKRCNTIKMDIPYDEWINHLRLIIAKSST